MSESKKEVLPEDEMDNINGGSTNVTPIVNIATKKTLGGIRHSQEQHSK